MKVAKFIRTVPVLWLVIVASALAQKITSSYCTVADGVAPSACNPIVVGEHIKLTVENSGDSIVEWRIKEDNKPMAPGKETILLSDIKQNGSFTALKSGTVTVTAKVGNAPEPLELRVTVFALGKLLSFDLEPIPIPLKANETYHMRAVGKFKVGNTEKTWSANDKVSWSSMDKLDYDRVGNITTRSDLGDFTITAYSEDPPLVHTTKVLVRSNPARPTPSYDNAAPALTKDFYASFIGGAEQVGLSSLPSQTEPFLRAYFQSGYVKKKFTFKSETRLWAAIRLLGAPEQGDTKGIYSVFSDPTGQLIATKFSSVGASIDFSLGPAFRVYEFADSKNSFDLIVGFGATTPLESNKVTQAYAVPKYGTAECNILTKKFSAQLADPQYNVKSPTDRSGANASDCLVNGNTAVTANGTTTSQAINTLAFSNVNRTGFFLRDLVGLRLNHTVEAVAGNSCEGDLKCFLGTLDLTFGHDAAITGGAFRGNRLIFRADAIYPIILKDVAAFYVFGSFATRLKRNVTDNTPLVLQSAVLSTVAGTGAGSVPNAQTIVLPLSQPDRDFYRIGVGIDILSLVMRKPAGK